MAFLGLKLGLDFEMRAAHAHQKFQEYPPGSEYHVQTTCQKLHLNLLIKFDNKIIRVNEFVFFCSKI